MTFRYIGSKARLAEQLRKHIGAWDGGVFVDAFCGTGAVAEIASSLGWPTLLNDHLVSSATMAAARLISSREARFNALGGYLEAVARLNRAVPVEGFIWREYSPASVQFCGIERRYFTEENARRIDGSRRQLAVWKDEGLLNSNEERVLIADLLGAVNRCANIAGTYGCFLSKWTAQSNTAFSVQARTLKPNAAPTEMLVGDVSDIRVGKDDVVYLDPPYTKRQYAAYYHLLETVAAGDEPVVEGVAGLRPWKDRASDFCYKVRALRALTDLIAGLPARKILLSYSSEGHIDITDLKPALNAMGRVSVIALQDIGRYRPNVQASAAGAEVKEYLIVIEKERKPVGQRRAPQVAEEIVA